MNSFDNIAGLVLATLSLVYLTYAMLRPEKF
jgi:K+-transporting ATPase KdpF subunit